MAFIRNTDRLVEGSSNKFFTESRAQLALQPTVEGLQSEDSGMKLRLDVIEGGAAVAGSIAKAQADAQAYADQKVAALINSAPEVLDTLKELSDALGGDASFASTVAGQIGAVDAKVDQEVLDRQAAIQSVESQHASDIASVEGQIEAEQLARESADSALSGRLDVLEQDPVTKTYVDGEVQELDGAFSAFQSDFEGRLGVLEADPVTKSYVDGEISSVEGQVSAEQSRAEAEEATMLKLDGSRPMTGTLDMGGNPLLNTNSISNFTLNYNPTEEYDSAGIVGFAIDPPVYVLPQANHPEFAIPQVSTILVTTFDIITGEPYVGPVKAAKSLNNDLIIYHQAGQATRQQIATELTQVLGFTITCTNPSSLMSSEDSWWYIASFGSIVGSLDILTTLLNSLVVNAEVVNVARPPEELNHATNKEYVDGQVSAEQSRAEGAESALSGRLDALEADPVTKTYVDGEVSSLQNQVAQEILDRQEAIQDTTSFLQGKIDAEKARAEEAEAGLGTQITDLTASVNSVEIFLQGQIDTEKGRIDAILDASEADKDSFAEIVSLINSVDTSNDSAFASYVLSNDAALAQEVSDRQAGDSALDLRLDSLEADPTTKSYVDSQVSSEASARQSADEALDSRLDVLESDPVTKSYVDGEVSSLESEDLSFFKLDGSRAMTGGLKVKYAEKSANYTLVESDYIIGVTNVSGGKTMTLPSAVTMGAGKIFIIKEKSGAASNTDKITIMPQSGQTIDGESNYEIKVSYESISVVSDGSNWFVM